MKYSFFSTIIAILFFMSCSSDKNNNIYPDSGGNPDKDAAAVDDGIETQDKDDAGTYEGDPGSDESEDQEDGENADGDDSDSIIIETDPCIPDPCVMENSDGNCTVIEQTFICGCLENYFWNGLDCIADPCASDPCKDVENATGECGIENGKTVCKCEPSYYWKENKCIILPKIVYVKSDASGLNDGSSWENAFSSFTEALESLGDPVEQTWVWVAEGTYKPEKNLNCPAETQCSETRYYNFRLISNVSVFGGFAGTETDISQRDWNKNKTVFSGDIDGTAGISGNDSYNVFLNFEIDSTAMIDGVIIENGNADYYGDGITDDFRKNGGGMNNWGSSNPVIRNVTFRNNRSKVQGGGLSNSYDSNPVVENCLFEKNISFKGAAFSSSDSSPSVYSSVFINNMTAEGYGGAVSATNSRTLFSECTFTGNDSEDAGAAFITENSSPKFEHCSFSGNTANRNGGAVSIGGFSNPDFLNCVFVSNLALGGGGAIEIYDGSEPFIINSKFLKNEAQKENLFSTGGAILVSDATPYLINCLFVNNTASAGGAISNRKGSSVLLNCTVAFNSASGELGTGGAMYNETLSEPAVMNTIMWYNNALNYDPEISNDMSTPVINNSNISGTFPEGVWDESFGTDTGDNISTDPMFNDPQNGDFTLFEDSFCINAGDNTPFETDGIAESIIKDLLGKDRILDGVVDIGAYESGPFSE